MVTEYQKHIILTRKVFIHTPTLTRAQDIFKKLKQLGARTYIINLPLAYKEFKDQFCLVVEEACIEHCYKSWLIKHEYEDVTKFFINNEPDENGNLW